jgi:hypothetical protein
MEMKKWFLMVALAGSAMAMASTEASAWYCRADSPSAYGWATRYSLWAAKRRALYECAIRTPRYQTCYITSCH